MREDMSWLDHYDWAYDTEDKEYVGWRAGVDNPRMFIAKKKKNMILLMKEDAKIAGYIKEEASGRD